MAKVSIILDERKSDKQGRFPIKLRICAKGSQTSISTGVFVRSRDYIGTIECAIARTCVNAKQINADICALYHSYLNAIVSLEHSGRIATMTAADIRDYVSKKREFVSERTFTSCLLEYKDMCRAEKTKQTYDYTLQMMERFKHKQKFLFEEIDYKFLVEFEKYMQANNIGASSRSIIFRNMRTICNYAINNDWIDMRSYPFRKFKIKHGNKEKVYLSEDKLHELLSLDLSRHNQRGLSMARDFFMLSFLLCGINPIDLYNLPKQSGSIKFVRQKIKFRGAENIHISIQPEAEYLIGEHKGTEHLLDFAERYCCFEFFYNYLIHRIKKLGQMIGCPGLSLYWARYSWATYASKIDVPDSTISKALGHTDSTLAEKKYVSFDWSKVDRANRRVIDYALYSAM